MLDFLLPRDDTAVLIQFVVVGAAGTVAIWRTWADPDRRIFTIGVVIVVLALLGVRAVH